MKSKCYLDSFSMPLVVIPVSSLDTGYLSGVGRPRACEPHKGCCWRKLSNSWHKGDIRGQRCGLAAPWALVQVVSSSSGALRSTAFLNLFQSIFLVHPMEQSLRAFPRTYLALTPLEFYYSFVKGDDSSQSHVMLLNLHVKIVVYP